MIASSLKDGDALVDVLLAKDAEPATTTNQGQTALHFAASKSNLDTAKRLIAHKASTRVKDKRGQLPLHRAAAVGNVPMVKLFLENRSPVNATDMDGCTALHHAIAEGHGDTALVLLKAGAEIDKRDTSGKLPIDLAPDAKVSCTRVWGHSSLTETDGTAGEELHHARLRRRRHRALACPFYAAFQHWEGVLGVIIEFVSSVSYSRNPGNTNSWWGSPPCIAS